MTKDTKKLLIGVGIGVVVGGTIIFIVSKTNLIPKMLQVGCNYLSIPLNHIHNVASPEVFAKICENVVHAAEVSDTNAVVIFVDKAAKIMLKFPEVINLA